MKKLNILFLLSLIFVSNSYALYIGFEKTNESIEDRAVREYQGQLMVNELVGDGGERRSFKLGSFVTMNERLNTQGYIGFVVGDVKEQDEKFRGFEVKLDLLKNKNGSIFFGGKYLWGEKDITSTVVSVYEPVVEYIVTKSGAKGAYKINYSQKPEYFHLGFQIGYNLNISESINLFAVYEYANKHWDLKYVYEDDVWQKPNNHKAEQRVNMFTLGMEIKF